MHPSSYKTPNEINGGVLIFGRMWICLAFLLISDSLGVAMCEDFIVLPSGSLDFVSFDIITGGILVADFFLGVYLHLSLQLLAFCY